MTQCCGVCTLGLPAEPPRVGDTLAALRQARALSLDELSRMAGVSKSMLSQIERAQANPTVAGQFEWYVLTVQPGGALESQALEAGTREHLTDHSGALQVQAGEVGQKLHAGETARYAVDCQHSIRNPGKHVANGWLVVVHPA